jgi:hypothetical protein
MYKTKTKAAIPVLALREGGAIFVGTPVVYGAVIARRLVNPSRVMSPEGDEAVAIEHPTLYPTNPLGNLQ